MTEGKESMKLEVSGRIQVPGVEFLSKEKCTLTIQLVPIGLKTKANYSKKDARGIYDFLNDTLPDETKKELAMLYKKQSAN